MKYIIQRICKSNNNNKYDNTIINGCMNKTWLKICLLMVFVWDGIESMLPSDLTNGFFSIKQKKNKSTIMCVWLGFTTVYF